MKDQILANLDNPSHLEKLYRTNKAAFKQAFNAAAFDVKDNPLTGFWNARLNFVKEEVSLGDKRELLFVIIAALIAGLVSRLQGIFHIDEDIFYSRNIGFIVFPALIAFFAWKNKISGGKITLIVGAILASVVFMNSLPVAQRSDTLFLSSIHMQVFLWSLLGFAFVNDRNDIEKRLSYLNYNGDLVVMTTLIVIAGAILSGITVGLFELIGLRIQVFYFENVIKFIFPAVPLMATYLIQTNPNLVGKVSPAIAKIFSPLVLVMLIAYLVAIMYSGKNPYNNREFLMVFNILLTGVMALIFFSVAGNAKSAKSTAEIWMLLMLSIVTIIVNGVALSAIVFRISEWGVSPNRLAVLGANVLILINLLIVMVQLYRVLFKRRSIEDVGRTISYYLPVYTVWTMIVTFMFPFIFGFR